MPCYLLGEFGGKASVAVLPSTLFHDTQKRREQTLFKMDPSGTVKGDFVCERYAAISWDDFLNPADEAENPYAYNRFVFEEPAHEMQWSRCKICKLFSTMRISDQGCLLYESSQYSSQYKGKLRFAGNREFHLRVNNPRKRAIRLPPVDA
ncbi:hypothetical protein K458DRAFT_390346 [Lentithecium fluviatile CBS 122367]|uniref:Uncharacterized protein n=1 Tax=Lentithecium fluviatile CBS 122367 TaxID=1168545 RepID=A0A6G1IYQ5_9PLEO|nr:hypothetical protein K458DRAFT_390346 [Lentithecium fluviatile CBS 122367]